MDHLVVSENAAAIARQRLNNLYLARPAAVSPAEMVARLAAVQSQEFPGAMWSLAQRVQGAGEPSIFQAFNAGEILRTHLLRPTWHFISPADIRWLLALTGPRVKQRMAPYFRKLDAPASLFTRSQEAVGRALEGGRQLTRDELRPHLQAAGIDSADNLLVTNLMMFAELDGLVCSGPRRGRQFTYALLEERVPPAPPLERQAALVELARRYFRTRGPAQVQDFANWSGLTTADGRSAIAELGAELELVQLDGIRYWRAPTPAIPPPDAPRAWLLSLFDEYISSYKDRRAMVAPEQAAVLMATGPGLMGVVVIAGQIAGIWSRTFGRQAVQVTTRRLAALLPEEERAVEEAVAQFGEYLGLPVQHTRQ